MSAQQSRSSNQKSYDYWAESRLPLTSLVFLAPLLAIYEAGVIFLGGRAPDAIRNGADHWMRAWLGQAGLGQSLVLPGLILVGLLVWHVCAHYPSRVSVDTLAGMCAESLLFAFLLIVFAQCQEFLFQSIGRLQILSTIPRVVGARVVTYIGAGIYEEVLFRLCLLPALYGLFRLSRLSATWAAALAVLSSSLAFALAHHIGPSAEPLQLFTFTFRALAGSFFAVLFVMRGFGITVGCHATYDIVVGILFAAGS